MQAKRTRRVLAHLCCVMVILVVATVFALNSEPATRSDPDRYYHYAVSEITAKEFAPPVLPQVEGLGWNKFFAEKEFLFHVISGAGYRMFQEKGVLVVSMAVGALVFLAVYVINAQVLVPFLAMLPVLFVLSGSSKFLIRIFSVRPQILAVLFSVLLLGALLRRRPRLAGVFSMLFALGYHAVYIPLAMAGVALFSAILITRDGKCDLFRASLKCFLYTFAGITIGLLVNPYFPSNVAMGIQVLKIALLNTGLPISHFGAELQSATGTSLLTHLAGFLFLAVVGIWFLGYHSFAIFSAKKSASIAVSSDNNYEALAAFGCFALFLIVTIHSPRGNEYLVPFAAIFLVRLTQTVARPTALLAGLTTVTFLLQLPDAKLAIGSVAESKEFFQEEVDLVKAKQALDRISINPIKNRVFNCGWDVSPYLFYTRPDLVFVDILDPSLLYERNPDFYAIRHLWLQGELPDSFEMLKNTFGADYVFCRDSRVADRLRSDPHLDVVFPKSLSERLTNDFTVFAVADNRPPEFVERFTFTTNLININADGSKDEKASWPPTIFEGVRPIFIDLLSISVPQNVVNEDIVCSDVFPDDEETARLTASSPTFVGLGGGPHLQLWVNEKLVYTNVNFSGARRLLHSLVQLDEPLTKDTSVRLRVCGLNQRTYLGTALSFWTKESWKALCSEKYAENVDFRPDAAAQHIERSEIECLAPLVSKQNNP